ALVREMDVADVIRRVAERSIDVDALPQGVGRVEVEADFWDAAEELVPHGRCGHEVLASRPLVEREQHRAVLDRQLDTRGSGMSDQRTPHLLDGVPLSLGGPMMGATQ